MTGNGHFECLYFVKHYATKSDLLHLEPTSQVQ